MTHAIISTLRLGMLAPGCELPTPMLCLSAACHVAMYVISHKIAADVHASMHFSNAFSRRGVFSCVFMRLCVYEGAYFP
jgi:hypothetical protein